MRKSKKAAGFCALLFAMCLSGGCGKDASAVITAEDLFLPAETEEKDGVEQMETEESEAAADSDGAASGKGDEDGAAALGADGEADGESLKDDNVVTITISAAGDVTLGNYLGQDYARSFVQTYEEQGNAYFFQNVKEYFLDDDMTIVKSPCAAGRGGV